MSEINYGNRCLLDECGVYIFAGEIVSDEPLEFRSFIAVNTNMTSVTVAIGGRSHGIAGGYAMKYNLSEVGVKPDVNIRVRFAPADFTGNTQFKFQVGLTGDHLSYTLAR